MDSFGSVALLFLLLFLSLLSSLSVGFLFPHPLSFCLPLLLVLLILKLLLGLKLLLMSLIYLLLQLLLLISFIAILGLADFVRAPKNSCTTELLIMLQVKPPPLVFRGLKLSNYVAQAFIFKLYKLSVGGEVRDSTPQPLHLLCVLILYHLAQNLYSLLPVICCN